MYRLSLISLSAIAIATLMAGNVNAQDVSPKKITVGPAIEFGNATAFGIQGKIPLGSNFSVRPVVLFGYQANVKVNVASPLSASSPGGLSQAEISAGAAAYGATLSAQFGNSLPLP